jgi:hypothetical protein
MKHDLHCFEHCVLRGHNTGRNGDDAYKQDGTS